MRKPDFLRAKEYKTMADHNAKLCADLVEECNSQGKIIDELSDENARLKQKLTSLADEYTNLEEKLDRLKEKRQGLRDYLDKIQDLTMVALGEDEWPKYPDD